MLSAMLGHSDISGVPVLSGAPFSLSLPVEGPVVLAVSGGGDSMAMLHLVRSALLSRGEGGRLHVVTVDHMLRPESASEAEFVAQTCRTLGLPHETLQWQGEKPERGVQAAARRARHGLLTRYAFERRAVVLIAHTADDQAETVAMRQRRNAEARDRTGGNRAGNVLAQRRRRQLVPSTPSRCAAGGAARLAGAAGSSVSRRSVQSRPALRAHSPASGRDRRRSTGRPGGGAIERRGRGFNRAVAAMIAERARLGWAANPRAAGIGRRVIRHIR